MTPDYKSFHRESMTDRNTTIRLDYANGKTIKELAEEYNRKTVTIGAIVREYDSNKPRHSYSIVKTKRPVLAKEDARHCLYSDGAGMSTTKILWKKWAEREGFVVDEELNSKEFTIVNAIKGNTIIKVLKRV